MIIVNLALPASIPIEAVFDQLPENVLVDTAFAAAVLGSSVAALSQQRHNGKGIKAVRLPCRKIRYRVADLKRYLVDNLRAI